MKVPFESFESPAIERMRSLTICPLRRFVFSHETETSFPVFSSCFEKSEPFRNCGRALSSAGFAGDAFEREKRDAGFGSGRVLPVRIGSGFFRNASFSTSRRFVRRLSVGLRPTPFYVKGSFRSLLPPVFRFSSASLSSSYELPLSFDAFSYVDTTILDATCCDSLARFD